MRLATPIPQNAIYNYKPEVGKHRLQVCLGSKHAKVTYLKFAMAKALDQFVGTYAASICCSARCVRIPFSSQTLVAFLSNATTSMGACSSTRLIHAPILDDHPCIAS